MADTFLTPSVFANEGIRQLENELVLGNKVHTDYSKDYAMIGDTLNIRKTTNYAGQNDNLDVTSYSEDITQGKTTIQMNKTVSIKVDIGAIDGTLSFDRVQEDVIRPPSSRCATVSSPNWPRCIPALTGSPARLALCLRHSCRWAKAATC